MQSPERTAQHPRAAQDQGSQRVSPLLLNTGKSSLGFHSYLQKQVTTLPSPRRGNRPPEVRSHFWNHLPFGSQPASFASPLTPLWPHWPPGYCLNKSQNSCAGAFALAFLSAKNALSLDTRVTPFRSLLECHLLTGPPEHPVSNSFVLHSIYDTHTQLYILYFFLHLCTFFSTEVCDPRGGDVLSFVRYSESIT